MIPFVSIRALAVLLIVIGIGWAGWEVAHKIEGAIENAEKQGYKTGYDKARAEDIEEATKAAAVARAKEADNAKRMQDAQDTARKRETRLRADAGALRNELDGLRDSLSSGRSALPAPACPAISERANTEADLLGECAAEVESLAGKADRHASDAQMILDAWPR